MSSKVFKHIVIDEINFNALKSLGQAGDSYNDVITQLLRKAGLRKE